jgi:16S rRNA (cytosine1402-N4)-methyltransferase
MTAASRAPATAAQSHASVMCAQAVAALQPRPDGVYADATLGNGGHAAAILEASAPSGRLIGIDRDEAALSRARERLRPFADRATLVHGGYADIAEILGRLHTPRVDGLIADFGVSSPQLDEPSRGFSWRAAGPLDMRMDQSSGPTLAELLEQTDEQALADILREYGEERRARAIARSICRARDQGELGDTLALRRAVVRVLGPARGRIDPATRTFQALRIAVNRELEQVELLLAALADVLADGAVAVILSFHSLEDRLVKRRFRDDPALQPLTKRPVQADDEERARNPRSRSAKLRAARRVPRTTDEVSA